MNKHRNTFYLTVLIVLTISMMWTVPVLADEGAPQSEEPAATETTPVEEPAADESEPVIEEPAPSDGAVAPASEGETLLEQLPENTTVVVVDENGAPLPLVTQEAAEAVATMPDPRWCPVGAVPGAVTCSPAFSKFNGTGGLIEWLTTNNPGVAGVIWVEAAYDSSVAGDTTAIILDGGVLTNMANVALTINGGWAGGASTTLNPNDLSEFNVPFQIVGWKGAVTLNNLLFSGATSAIPLYVSGTGNITVNNVDVVNSNIDAPAAYLKNDDGTGNVVVNDSTFSKNSGGSNSTGLYIRTKGTVTLKNITANENVNRGLYIVNSSATTPKTVTLTGSNQFMRNGSDGLVIYSDGLITLSNITAEGNGIYGLLANNFNTGNTAGVTLKGANSFNNNGWDGLNITTNGAVTLANITANDNGTKAARPGATDLGGGNYDYNAAGKGAVIINKSAAPKLVTLTGVNTFNGNASTGLLIDSSALITVSNLTANNNGCDLAYEGDNFYCAGAFLQGAGVTLTGYGNFTGNDVMGLKAKNAYVTSSNSYVGALTLNNLYAEGNGLSGVWLKTEGALSYNITLLGVNTFLNNGYDGLNLTSNGAVSLSNITANGNSNSGVYVNNSIATSARAVILNGVGTYTDNGWMGLQVVSQGTITTNGLTALNNGSAGVSLDNCGESVGVCQALFAGQGVNVNGLNTISNNNGVGLYVLSRGAITISSLTASGNASTGVYANNQYNNALGGVTFTNYLNSFNNGNFGVMVYSRGAVSLINVLANGNGNTGVYIENSVDPALQSNVTIAGTNSFSYNSGNGLDIFSYGVVTLNSVSTNGNVSLGAYLDNYLNGSAVAAKGVTLTGTNFFNGNGVEGLYIQSSGAIVLNKITANFNGSEGLYADNKWNKFSQPITLIGYGIFNGNGNRGAEFASNGNITLANLTANNNANYGVEVNNNSLTTNPATTALSVNVTITGVNNFNNNLSDGLHIKSDGVVTLSNITANYNGAYGYGLFVDNVNVPGGSTAKGFTLTGWNNFIGNGNTGLRFNISGNVLLNRVVSSYNNDSVVDANAAHGIDGTAAGTITLVCASLNGNEGAGYLFSAPGKLITLTGVFSYGNGAVNSATGTPVVVTRTCTLP